MSLSASIAAVLYLFTSQQGGTLSGEIYTPFGDPSSTYTVELTTSTGRMYVDRTYSNSAGKFEFRNVTPGNYTIYVKTEAGDVLGLQEVASGSMTVGQTRIEISETPRAKPVNGTVSATTLQHRVPKKAVQEMNLAIRASRESDSERAREHLKAAIRVDPDFSEAHTNLGAEYIREGDFVQAYSEFDNALKLGPKGAMQYCNIAIAAMAMLRFDEAEREVRAALQLDSRSSQANYVLGKLLARQPGHRDEAVRRLKLAAPDIASANILLGQLLSPR